MGVGFRKHSDRLRAFRPRLLVHLCRGGLADTAQSANNVRLVMAGDSFCIRQAPLAYAVPVVCCFRHDVTRSVMAIDHRVASRRYAALSFVDLCYSYWPAGADRILRFILAQWHC